MIRHLSETIVGRQYPMLRVLSLLCVFLALGACSGYYAARDVTVSLQDSATPVVSKVKELKQRDESLIEAINQMNTALETAQKKVTLALGAGIKSSIDRDKASIQAYSNKVRADTIDYFELLRQKLLQEVLDDAPAQLTNLTTFIDNQQQTFLTLQSQSNENSADMRLARNTWLAAARHRTAVAIYRDLIAKAMADFDKRYSTSRRILINELDNELARVIKDFEEVAEKAKKAVDELETPDLPDSLTPAPTEAYDRLIAWVEAVGLSGKAINEFLNSPVLLFREFTKGGTEALGSGISSIINGEIQNTTSEDVKKTLDSFKVAITGTGGIDRSDAIIHQIDQVAKSSKASAENVISKVKEEALRMVANSVNKQVSQLLSSK